MLGPVQTTNFSLTIDSPCFILLEVCIKAEMETKYPNI